MWRMNFMSIKTNLSHFIGRHRFLSRNLRSFQPEISKINISHQFDLFLDPKDLSGPSFYVMHDKGVAFYHYEEDLKAEIIQHLPKGGVFFDVGANIGLISLFVSKFHPEAKIFSFEPGSVVSHCLKETISHNKLKNLTLINKGVSDYTGTAEFFVDPKSTGGSSLIKQHEGSKDKYVEKIELLSLDEFSEKQKVVPNIIKIDVEGAEKFAVKGALNLIKNVKPHFVIEVEHKNFLGDSAFWIETFQNYTVRGLGEVEFIQIPLLIERIKKEYSLGIKARDYSFKPNV